MRNTIRQTSESDENGVVHLDVGVGEAHRRVEVVVIWGESQGDLDARARRIAELGPLAGALANDPIERPEQPVIEARLVIE